MIRLLLALGAVACLGGCRASLDPQAFDPRARMIEDVAILPVYYEDEFVFEYAQDQLKTLNAIAPGPLGTAISAAVRAAGRSDFNERLGANTTPYAEDLGRDLVDAVTDAGYGARLVSDDVLGSDPARRGGLLRTLPRDVFDDADAVLESFLELGFVASGRGQPFRPMAWLTLRATRADGRVLLLDRIMFNARTSDDGDFIALRGIRLHVPEWLEFKDPDTIISSGRSDEALVYAVDRVVSEVRFMLVGPWL